MAEQRKGYVYREIVNLDFQVSQALLEEAQRRGVSRSHIGREALEQYLGFQGEGRWEPSRTDKPGENFGRR